MTPPVQQQQQEGEPKKDLLTTELLLHRLHAGLGIAGGGRGSLTKCATTVLRQQQQQGDDADLQQQQQAAITEFQLQQLELTKLFLGVQRNAAEIRQLEEEAQTRNEATTNQSAAQTQTTASDNVASLSALRSELARLQQVQSCLQEYEALARLTVGGRHTVSEHLLQKTVSEMEAQQRQAHAQWRAAAAVGRVRQAQVQCLQQCLADLQQSVVPQDSNDSSSATPIIVLEPHELEQVEREAAEENHNDQEEDGGDDPMEEEEERRRRVRHPTTAMP